ncbi:transcription initiation factor TFIID subunit 15-like [Momordica charantia]|uniref:Transcription initiation factor TFIID subunit 15-like n=1 Tax=Momordica charantia TaxID=3673 RepID=A0A6J1DB61_MOMCH|nr:transcription initiation factor TFIID subunit 15-like [Momordica charantia]XP_022150610.1 transcription initiation factor TFIID subunit 15-like [Momordica charantia]
MNRPGDWHCRSCQHLNFQRRECCQRCGDSKFGVFAGGGGGRLATGRSSVPSSYGGVASPGSDVRPGDWYCGVGNCGTHNFASRSSCFKCGAFKDESAAAGAGAGGGFDFDMSRASRGFGFGTNASRAGSSWKSGDWICTRSGCNEHNFASRMECFRCNDPRDSS